VDKTNENRIRDRSQVFLSSDHLVTKTE